MARSTHYETLGVSPQATLEEIKVAFRKKSLETHPDLQKASSCSETFKQIANAHSVLSSPISRKEYDRQLQEEVMWRGRGRQEWRGNSTRGDGYYGARGNVHHPSRRKPGLHVAMETLSNPRYMTLGVMMGLAGVTVLGSLLGSVSSSRPAYHSSYQEPMVEAWKNPHTGHWEQPAPWDPLYRKLQPKLEKVPRGQVRPTTIR